MNHITINRNANYDAGESEITVYFTYSQGRPARGPTYSCGGEPPEDDEIEIIKIETEYGNDILKQLSEDEVQAIELHLYETWEDTEADDMADYQYEQQRDANIYD